MHKTPLNETHKKLGAKMTEFGGWEMPVQYDSIIKEHKAVRENCGLFDISHMGELEVKGDNALDFLQKVITRDISDLKTGQAAYTLMCNKKGGIIDDYLVYKTANNKYLLVVNAANTEKDFKWINEKSPEDVSVRNLSFEYALLALQGPKSIKVISSLTDIELTELAGYHFIEGKLAGVDVLLSRTGYTGEDGFEIYFDISKAEHLWQQIFEAGKELGLKPVGLGARNTLRLEKALCLHGNDIDESTDPLQAGLSFVVDLDKKDFIGKQSLEKIKKEGIKEKLAGFEMMERGIPRHGYKIKYNNKIIGEVTSGSYSPSLNKNIGLGYIENEFNEPGTKISIDIRGKSVNAKIVETPFI